MALDLKQLVKRAFERVKASQAVDDDQAVAHLEVEVIRTMAELEVAHQKVGTAPSPDPPPASPADRENEDNPPLRKVA